LLNNGYRPRDINIFIIYNSTISYEECEKKRTQCFIWRHKIIACRNRPLNQTFDDFNARLKKVQSSDEYHINYNWSDKMVKVFSRNCNNYHNKTLRLGNYYHSLLITNKKLTLDDDLYRDIFKNNVYSFLEAQDYVPDLWDGAKNVF
jgi:hypothetical protein